MYDLLIRNVHLLFSETKCDIAVQDGKIVKIGQLAAPARQVIEGEGRAALPPYVESHIHLDTALTSGIPHLNESGELFEGIELWNTYRSRFLTEEDVKKRARTVINEMVQQGVLYMRTMVDVSDPDLTALRALLQVKKEVASFLTLQLVAFPQNGLTGDGASQLRRALELGADCASAVPHLEPTREKGVESLRLCFEVANEFDADIHLFCDEIDDGASRFVETAADLARENGMGRRVTISHANAMAYYPEAYTRRLIGSIKASGIQIVTCPLISTAVQGRLDSWPKGRGLTRVKELHAAGINVAVAHDDFLSPFYPLGTGSLLSAGHMLLHQAHMTGADDFDAVYNMMTVNAARVLGIENYGMAEGHPAHLIIVSAQNAHDLLRRQPPAELVLSRGRIISKTIPAKTTLMIERAFI
ncbi:amidohydrolase family protein [Domibacillus robiginosus]|uniref:amidohydrolase family protein n=1 Tax=Domibacillus robiginosus TaxID=1071054 RepID=UPI00067D0EF7|nr:amidohydrolase family protein [Domibacillus robiginosus]